MFSSTRLDDSSISQLSYLRAEDVCMYMHVLIEFNANYIRICTEWLSL